jgi:hypothetical protein
MCVVFQAGMKSKSGVDNQIGNQSASKGKNNSPQRA